MSETIYDGGDAFSDFSETDGVIDYRLPLGQVRLLILDNSPVREEWLFTDPELDALLALSGGGVKRTAALALGVVALSEAMLSKKIRTQDLQTDGPALAAELRAQAKALTGQADAEDAAAEGSYFEIVPNGCDFPEASERPIW